LPVRPEWLNRGRVIRGIASELAYQIHGGFTPHVWTDANRPLPRQQEDARSFQLTPKFANFAVANGIPSGYSSNQRHFSNPDVLRPIAMRKLPLQTRRNLFALGLALVFGLGLAWHFSSGIPVIFGPHASASTRQAGYELFVHEWQPNDPLSHGDGVGPVFNANSCVACHNQGGAGGGGDNSRNVTNFVVLPNSRDGGFKSGTIHAEAVSSGFQESTVLVHNLFPVVRGETRVENHCSYRLPDFDPVRQESVQTTALFGAGWVDRISSKAISSNRRGNLISGALREMKLDFDSIPAGRARILPDGRIGKFGWKAQFATLEEFVAAACANEVGLGTPKSKQATPISQPNYPEQEPDLNRKQFRALVAFVDTLPKPIEINSDDAAVVRGKELFKEVGCAVCHVPDMGGVKGVYSDFLLHHISDSNVNGSSSYGSLPPNVTLPDDLPNPDEWKTPALWGVADSAPYLHDGSAGTLEQAIGRHGGDAKSVREAFQQLAPNDRAAIIGFLKTLKAPPTAIQVAAK
jgi:mono/diheme cytochrome c family protein